VTWRITDRSTFDALRRSGRRARSGSVSVIFVNDGGDRVRVAYAVGRRFGGAVERNRLRRRMRAAVRAVELQVELNPGAYLVLPGKDTTRLGYEDLVETLKEAMRRAQAQRPAQVGAESDTNATQRA
jgi:ribonuclease P protein component